MKALEAYYRQNSQKLKVVFFDIFDTIILRDVHPEYTKKIWSKRIGIKLNLSMKYGEIYSLRNRIEAELCEKNRQSGYDLEFNYNDFSKTLYDELNKIESSKVNKYSYDEFISLCRGIEIEVEKSVQLIDDDWLVFVKRNKQKGIKIVCVSDFYLTKEMVSELFKLHGINNLIDDIYVSSEFLLTKRSGRLYDKVLELIQCPPEDILMVGDNEHSDILMAKSKGMHTHHVDRKERRAFYESFEQKYSDRLEIEKKLSNCLWSNNSNYFEQIALTLYSFTEKLHNKLSSEGVKDIFFLSREGEFLKVLFDIYQQCQGYNKSQYIKSHYLIVSRKSTFLPSLKSLSQENFEILFRQYRRISLFDFLSSLNLSDEEMLEISKAIAVDLNQKEEDLPTSQTFIKLLNCPLFQSIYEIKRIEQNNNFKQYIESFGVNVMKNGLSLVDVGWKGTIQDNISRIFDGCVEVNGYYLGLVAPGALTEKNKKEGIIFTAIPEKSPYFRVYNENRALFEILLGASHGSANGYVKEGKIIKALTYHEPEEIKLFNQVVKPIQQNIESLYLKICDILCKRNYESNDLDEYIAKNHARMVFFPNKEQLLFFSKIYHFENFGVFEYTKFDYLNKVSLGNKVKNMVKLFRNPKGLLETGFWGPITLKNAGLGFMIYSYGLYRYYTNILKVGDSK